jgi:hypothetical protein
VLTREDLQGLVVAALKANGGSAPIVDVCKYVWQHHEQELRASGDLFYTWQYDIRWAAQRLRDNRVLISTDSLPRGLWAINPYVPEEAEG